MFEYKIWRHFGRKLPTKRDPNDRSSVCSLARRLDFIYLVLVCLVHSTQVLEMQSIAQIRLCAHKLTWTALKLAKDQSISDGDLVAFACNHDVADVDYD